MCFTHSGGYLTFRTDSDVFTHFNHQGALIRAFDGQWDLPRSSPAFVDNDYCGEIDASLSTCFHYLPHAVLHFKSDRRELCGGKFICASQHLYLMLPRMCSFVARVDTISLKMMHLGALNVQCQWRAAGNAKNRSTLTPQAKTIN